MVLWRVLMLLLMSLLHQIFSLLHHSSQVLNFLVMSTACLTAYLIDLHPVLSLNSLSITELMVIA